MTVETEFYEVIIKVFEYILILILKMVFLMIIGKWKMRKEEVYITSFH